jgi:hypothetical protein
MAAGGRPGEYGAAMDSKAIMLLVERLMLVD